MESPAIQVEGNASAVPPSLRDVPRPGTVRHRRSQRRPAGPEIAGSHGGRARPARHTQDPARDHHHAGEPVVRLLLRRLPGRRRDPDEGWRACRLRARSIDGQVRRPVRGPQGPESRRAAPGRRQRGGRGRREDGWLHRQRRARPLHQRPQVRRRRGHGLPRAVRHPQLLGVRQALRAGRPHVRVGRVLELHLPPGACLRVGGQVPGHPQPDEL